MQQCLSQGVWTPTSRTASGQCASSSKASLPRPLCACPTSQRRMSHSLAGVRSPNSRQDRRSLHVSASTASRAAVAKEMWWERNNPPNMKTITSVQQFVDELAIAGDRLVIVDFYAKWCNACRSLFPKLCQICAENPDIVVLKVDFDENRDIVKPMAIKVLPFFHFYRGSEGRVAAFSASIGKIQRLRDALAQHGTPRCSLGKTELLPEFAGIIPQPYGENMLLRHPLQSLEKEFQSMDKDFKSVDKGFKSMDREWREPAAV